MKLLARLSGLKVLGTEKYCLARSSKNILPKDKLYNEKWLHLQQNIKIYFAEDQILIAFYQNFAHSIDVLGMVKSY